MYQSTCGSVMWNESLPVVAVHANVFSGPPVELSLTASDAVCTSKSQREAQQAIDFLHQVCIAHVWVARQVALMVHEEGVLWELATAGGKRFDHHVLIGAMQVDAMAPSMTVFGTAAANSQNMLVDLRHHIWSVTLSALVQCISVQRFNEMLRFNELQPYNTQNVNTVHFEGIVTLQQLWAMLLSIAGRDTNQYWYNTICKALGTSTKGLKTATHPNPSTITITNFELSDDFATTNMYTDLLTGVMTRYYDCICNADHEYIVLKIHWRMPDGSSPVDMLPRMKRLKVESNKNTNGLQARNQAQNLEDLHMVDGLGITTQADCLNSVCLRSMHETLPNVDVNLKLYIDSFKAPYVVLFLRMIRCTNLMAFEHLAKTFNRAQLTEAFARKVGRFSVGTIADIDYIMKYTTYNTHHVHSLYFKVKNDTSKVLQDAAEHGKEYNMIAIVNSIVLSPTEAGDKNLKDSPLYYKLLLCAKPLYDLVHSLQFNIVVDDLPRNTLVNLRAGLIEEKRTKWRKKASITIVRTFTKGRLLCYVYQDYNDGIGMVLGNCVDILFTDHMSTLQSETDDDSNSEYAEIIISSPILLSWPLRDINVFRGCSKRRRLRPATSNIMYYDFPYLRKLHQDSSMHHVQDTAADQGDSTG